MQRNADVGVLSNFYADGWYRWKAVTSLPGHFGSVPNTRRNFLNSGLRPSNRQEIFHAGCLSRFFPKFPKCRSETAYPRYHYASLHYRPDITGHCERLIAWIWSYLKAERSRSSLDCLSRGRVSRALRSKP